MNVWLKEFSFDKQKINAADNSSPIYKISIEKTKINTPSTAYMTLNQTSRVQPIEPDVKKT